MRIGRTIGGRREQVETESERLLHREKIKRRKMISVVTYLAILAVIGLGIVSIIIGMKKRGVDIDNPGKLEVEPVAQIVDEASIGVPRKVKEFVGYLEQDLKEYGLVLARAVIPRNKSREIDVYINDFGGYFKLSLDRGAGVAAEDMDRIVRYLKSKSYTGVEYVDLRVQEKAYYKLDTSSQEEASQEEESQPSEQEEGATASAETDDVVEYAVEEYTEVEYQPQEYSEDVFIEAEQGEG